MNSLVKLTEARHHRRLPTAINCQILLNGSSRTAQITNLSLKGLQLTCDQSFIESVKPDILRLDPSVPLKIEIQFETPQSKKASKTHVALQCQVIYSRRQSQAEYIIGCSTLTEASKGVDHIEYYLSQLGRVY